MSLLNCTEPAWASENERVCKEREDEDEWMKEGNERLLCVS